ncbi:helical backbone metal receptor [Euzebya sp.]|uniref:helical backbone metal receptor n=1 Tax=Euzebya sp. TaxID=1971409 RepID=UPI003511D5A0
MRIVSIVPSLTDLVASLGAGEDLVAVTDWCTDGAPATAARIRGTKNPDVQRIVALRPDVVLANTEENTAESLDRLREAGLAVEETYPRTVVDAAAMIRRVGEVLDRRSAAEPLAAAVDAAREAASWPDDRPRVMALTLVWRKPWMGLGPTTYADDLLWTCGFANVLSGADEPYPRLDPALVLGPDVVLLPSEPYEFGEADLEAVAELVGADVPARFVDGQALTWHGPRTAEAITTFSALARELAGLG